MCYLSCRSSQKTPTKKSTSLQHLCESIFKQQQKLVVNVEKNTQLLDEILEHIKTQKKKTVDMLTPTCASTTEELDVLCEDAGMVSLYIILN